MILDKIAEAARERVAFQKNRRSLADVRSEAEASPAGRDFAAALRRPGLSVIAELKKASPSKGLISPDFEEIYLQQAQAYEDGGAAAISCLTEPLYFLGSDEFLRQVHKTVALPVLRKDFTIDEYQIYEAKALGADAVLLICSLLSGQQLQEYLCLTQELGLAALTEAHSPREIEQALQAGAGIIGVNNRNLQDFTVNTGNSLSLRELVPEDRIFVAESGITCAADTVQLKKAGVSAVLIGEALMRAADPAAMLREICHEGR